MKTFDILNRVKLFDTLDSTNLFLLQMLKENSLEENNRIEEYSAVVANSQRAGYGKYQRSWVSSPGNLYLSFVCFLHQKSSEIYALPFIISISIAEALSSFGLDHIKLKWPNDLICDGKKVGGVLIESGPCFPSEGSPDLLSFVVGIGINLVSSPDHVDYKTTYLREQGIEIDRLSLIKKIIERVIVWRDSYKNKIKDIFSCWQDYSLHQTGDLCIITCNDKQIEGTFIGLDSYGRLGLRHNKGGEVFWYASGDVSIPLC